jgi:DNA repair protein RadC
MTNKKSIFPISTRNLSGFVREPEEPGVYSASRVSEDQIIESAKRIIANRMRRKSEAMTSPTLVKDFLIMHFADAQAESFCVLYLDNQHRLIDIEELFHGTIDGASIYPREVVKAALTHNAAAVTFSHNHPSGFCQPSSADEFITKRLKDALAMVDIRTLDHFIVAGTEVYAFSENGRM